MQVCHGTHSKGNFWEVPKACCKKVLTPRNKVSKDGIANIKSEIKSLKSEIAPNKSKIKSEKMDEIETFFNVFVPGYVTCMQNLGSRLKNNIYFS